MADLTAITKDGPIKLHDNGDGTYSEQVYLGGQAATLGSGSSVGGGSSTYSNSRGDFAAASTTGAKTITLSAFANSNISAATLSVRNFSSGSAVQISSGGARTTIPMTSIAYNTARAW